MSIISPNQQKKQLKEALRFLSKGQVQKAVDTLEDLVKIAPMMPEVHFQLATLAVRMNAPVIALKHSMKARILAPTEVAVWKISARSLLAYGQDEEIDTFKKDLRNAPIPMAAKKKLFEAMEHVSLGGFGGAPKEEADAMIAALVKNDFKRAYDIAADLSKRYPNSAHILNALAAAQEGLGQIELADANFNRAVYLEPNAPAILVNYARFLSTAGRWASAAQYGEKSLKLRPGEPRTQAMLARIHSQSDNFQRALELADQAISGGFPSRDAFIAKAQATSEIIGAEAGLLVYEDYISKTQDETIKVYRGNLHQQRGDFESARKDYLGALNNNPEDGSIYLQISLVHKFSKDDELLSVIEEAARNESMTEASQIAVNFALSKAYEDSKQTTKVFEPLNKANKLVSSAGNWKQEVYDLRETRTHELVQKVDLQAIKNKSIVKENPIFVTGLPRSGTTLTEQILSSHSTLTGVGEAFWAGRYFRPLLIEGEENQSPAARILSAGLSYQSSVREIYAPEQRIVDKALMNHERVGFLNAAIPNSKIVILKRDPRDNLLSIYKNRFASNSIPFNSDMRALAYVYAMFLRYLDYWEKTIPGSFYTLDYDKLTADPENEIRKLLEYCELDWEDGVMDYGGNKNTIKTLSVYQARQPIYRSSVRSWEKYADDLKPMIDALKEFGVPLDD